MIGGGQGGRPPKSANGPTGSPRLYLEDQMAQFLQLEKEERNEGKEEGWERSEERRLGDA